jgi:hypothetical protein
MVHLPAASGRKAAILGGRSGNPATVYRKIPQVRAFEKRSPPGESRDELHFRVGEAFFGSLLTEEKF